MAICKAPNQHYKYLILQDSFRISQHLHVWYPPGQKLLNDNNRKTTQTKDAIFSQTDTKENTSSHVVVVLSNTLKNNWV